jgi:hypothetical protein
MAILNKQKCLLPKMKGTPSVTSKHIFLFYKIREQEGGTGPPTWGG